METNLTRIHEGAGLILGLASLSGLRIRHCCELGCRPAAAAPIRPLAWELPHATSIAIKRKKRKEKKRKITDSLSNDKGRNGYDNYCERQNNGSSKITISQFLEPVNILY